MAKETRVHPRPSSTRSQGPVRRSTALIRTESRERRVFDATPLAEQHTRLGPFTAPFAVLRPLTPLTVSYEAAKKRAEPYSRIVGELPEMRTETVNLVTQAVAEQRRAYVLVNNRAEGNAPLTIQALQEHLGDGYRTRVSLLWFWTA